MSLSGGFGNAGHFEFIDTSDVPSKTFSVVSSDEPTVILANFTTDWYGRANIWLPLPSPVFKGRLWIDADNDGIFDSGDIDLPNTGISLFFANGTLFENGTTLGDGTFAFNLTEPVQGQQFSVSLQTGQVLINPVTTNSMGNAFADVRLLSEDVRAITVSSSTRNVYIGGAVVSSNFLFGGISVANSDVTGVTCDCVVGMMDNTGSAAWIRSFGSADGNEKVMGIAVDDSEAATGSGAGDVYIVGSFTSGSLTLDGTVLQNTGSVGTPDIFVARLDGRNGSVIWAKGFGTANADEALGVAVGVTSAHIYVVGYYTDTALTLGANSLANVGLKDGFVAQLATADGSVGWAHSQSSSGVDMTHSVAVDRSGSVGAIVVGGQFEKGDVQVGQTGSWTAQGGDADAFMATYNPSTGAYLHGRAWGGSGSDVLISLAVHPGSGAIYATGSSSSTSVTFGGAGPDPATKPRAGKSIWVAKHNGTGAPGWYKVFQGAGVGDDGSFGIQVDLMSEAVYIVGTLGSSGGLPWGSQNVTSRMFVGQLSPQGTAINATEIAVAYHSIFNHAWALHVDRRSNIWVGGGAATMQFASLGAPASTSVTALQQTAFLALYDEGLASQSAAAELQVLGSGGFTPGMEEFTAFDGSLATYVDSGSTANPWFGLDLKRPRTIHKIRWHCRASELSLCAGATFEAASSSNFASATSLYQQTSPPQADWMTIDLSGTTQYQYVRMVPATGTNGSRTVEMEVYAA